MATDYVSFRVGDVFPADDLLAEWVATLALAFNDIALVHARMIEDQGEGEEYKFFYWTRLAISHFAEAADYLITTEHAPEVQGFVESLSDELQRHYSECVNRYRERQTEIEQIRNIAGFHYPELRVVRGRRPMQQALAALENEPGRVKRGPVLEGRFLFADDVAAMLFVRTATAWDSVVAAHGDIEAGIDSFMRFANPAITEFFGRAAVSGVRLYATKDRPGAKP